mgnify:FL=1
MRTREIVNEINSLLNQSTYLYAQYAQENRISYVEMMVLYSLLNTYAPLTQIELGAYYVISKQSINSAVKKNKTEGFILTVQDEKDKRQKYLKLTSSGEKYAHSVLDKMMKIEDEVTAILGDKNKAIIDGLEMYNMLFEKRLNKK